jgi:L-ascorbate metabolism protein UlaG (beta-lactamase superfamily)
MADATLTWLGHSSFRLDSPGGKRIYVDPWLDGPTFPEAEKEIERIDVLALTHGHGDHAGSAVDIAKQHEPAIVAMVELKGWLGAQGAPVGQMPGMNKGGTQKVEGISFTMVDAKHSSSTPDGSYAGEAAGIVVELEDGKKIYFAGDTCVFGDMQLIARLYQPDVAVLPIGDNFTMGPREAALALELLGNPRCVPCHYGTFPLLTGTPAELQKLMPNAQVESLEPGDSVTL